MVHDTVTYPHQAAERLGRRYLVTRTMAGLLQHRARKGSVLEKEGRECNRRDKESLKEESTWCPSSHSELGNCFSNLVLAYEKHLGHSIPA